MASAAEMHTKSGILISDGTSYTLRMAGPVMVLSGGTHLDTGLRLSGIGANTSVKVGWRVGEAFSDDMEAWGNLSAPQGTARSMNGTFAEAFSLSAHASKMFVQAGLFTSESGAGSEAVNAEFGYSVREGGFLAARQTIMLPPSQTDRVIPIGSPFPTSGVSGLVFGLRFSGVSGTIVSPTTKYRTFDSPNDMYPNTWSDVSAESNITSNETINSSSGVATTGKLLAQAGFQYRTTGTSPYATLEVLVAARVG